MLTGMRAVGCCAALLAMASSPSCGQQLPGAFVGESAHFRLYVSSGVVIPPDLDTDRALVALESNWRDMATLLPLQTGSIEYHWVTPSELSSACGGPAGGCEQQGPIVIADGVPIQHELNHAYIELLAGTHAPPVPLVTEGFAGAIGCGDGLGVQKGTPTRWQDLLALPGDDPRFDRDGYSAGALLVRYLIRSGGIDAFISYYRQAPKVRDPALFADHFQRFWGITLDAAWSAMNTVSPGTGLGDTSLCPCSLPSLPLDQPLAVDRVSAPYWTIPEVDGKTIAMHPVSGAIFDDFDCHGETFDGSGTAGVGLIRLGPTVHGYVLAPLASTTTGHFVSDTCEAAELFQVPPSALGLGLSVQVDQSSAASNVVYLRLVPPPGATALSVPLGIVDTCATCAFDEAACAAVTAISPGTPVYVQLPLTVQKASAAQVTSTTIFFQ